VVAEKKVAHQQKNAISRFYGETVGELKKVNWPTRQEATNLTTIVLIVIATMAVFLGLLDILFSRLFGMLLKL
jgi:preprotein translocase subunit SecE